jgi:hypothetical protein
VRRRCCSSSCLLVRIEAAAAIYSNGAEHAHRILVLFTDLFVIDDLLKPMEIRVIPRKQGRVFLVIDVHVRVPLVAAVGILLEALLYVIHGTLQSLLLEIGSDDPECPIAPIGMEWYREKSVRHRDLRIAGIIEEIPGSFALVIATRANIDDWALPDIKERPEYA